MDTNGDKVPIFATRSSQAKSLFIRRNEDLLGKLQECQTVLREVELLVPGRTAKRIKDLLVRRFVLCFPRI